MSSDLTNFDRAEYIAEPPPQLTPGAELIGSSWNPPAVAENFPVALLAGVLAAAVGSCIYAAFTIITHIEIGFLGLFLGAVIASAMMQRSGHLGGRRYQLAAATLTYLSISSSTLIQMLYSIHAHGRDLATLTPRTDAILAGYGIASPFLEFKYSFANAAIGLFILFISIRSAWKVAAGKVQPPAA